MASGDGPAAPAGSLEPGYSRGAIAVGELEPASGRRIARLGASAAAPRGRRDERRRRIKVKYYIGADVQTVAPGAAQLFEIRCPVEREQPLTGGSFAPVGGLVVVNSSRTNPSPGFPTRSRAWYEAVVNITEVPLQWRPFVTCLRAR